MTLPEPGYLQAPQGPLPPRTARYLAFDEVKTGATTMACGRGRWRPSGVAPDLACLREGDRRGPRRAGRSVGTEEVMGLVVRGEGRPAGRHVQRQPAHDGGGPGHAPHGGAHARGRVPAHFDELHDDPGRTGVPGGDRAVPAAGLRGHGARREGRGELDRREPGAGVPGRGRRSTSGSRTAAWLWQQNGAGCSSRRGRSGRAGRSSVAHTEEDARRYVENFEELRRGADVVADDGEGELGPPQGRGTEGRGPRPHLARGAADGVTTAGHPVRWGG
ncbi:MAG: hypothetical protein KatS3mg014_0707 [Actinomycetota bacterium]|nr:MAG: hypothetical protein KatS3mg014_0707 [Actinomycetota bacterium]